MILLKDLTLGNFLSHKQTYIPFSEGDKVLLDGVSGSGKSSIVDAIIWCLYGVGRVGNRSLILNGATSAVVTLVLLDGEEEYKIERSITAKGAHSITAFKLVKGEYIPVDTAGTRETQQWIERDLLHCSYELFINSVAYPQGNRESFVNATSSRRKELLLEILKTEDIASYLERTKTRLSEGDKEIKEFSAARVIYTQQIMMNKVYLSKEKESKEDRVKFESSLAEMEQHVQDLSNELRKIEASAEEQKRVGILTEKIKTAQAKAYGLASGSLSDFEEPDASYIQSRITELESSIQDEEEVTASLASVTEWNNKRNALLADRPSVVNYDSEIDDLTRQLDVLLKDMPDCPAGNDCPYMKGKEPQIEYIKKRRDDKIAAQEEQNTLRKNWENKIELLGAAPDATQLNARYNEIRQIHQVILKFQRQLNDATSLAVLEFDIETMKEELGSIDADNIPTEEQISLARSELQQAKDAVSLARSNLTKLEANLLFIDEIKIQQRDLLKNDKDANEKLKVLFEKEKMFSELREAFGPNGIQAVALDYLLPSLEEKINGVLSQLSDFRVRLDTQRASASKDAKVEGLFITIRNEMGEEFSYDSFSGGEKLKVTVAISEALASLQNLGFRIFDEAIVGLDDENIESFTHVLSQIQGRFSQVLCISHLRQIKDLFDRQILLDKTLGVSSVRLG